VELVERDYGAIKGATAACGEIETNVLEIFICIFA